MNKYKKLALGFFLDALGYASYIFPGLGEFTDFVWAPLSAYIMTNPWLRFLYFSWSR